MWNALGRDDRRAVGLSVVFLLLSVGLTIGLRKLDITDTALLITLFLIPLVVYGVASGRIREFSAPGGWGAKFAEAAAERVDPTKALVELSTEEMEAIPKTSLEELQQRIGQIRDGRPIVMTMALGRTGYYQPHAVSYALQTLGQFRNFKFIVFLDQEGKVVAYAPSWALRAALERDAGGSQLIAAVNDNRVDEVRAFPGMLTEFVSQQTTNAEALEKMERLNLEAIVAVDTESKQLVGVVERDRLLSRMVSALARGAATRAT